MARTSVVVVATEFLVRKMNSSDQDLLKIVIIGDSGVGKTAIRNWFVHEKFLKTKQTLGADFMSKTVELEEDTQEEEGGEGRGTKRKRKVTLQIWDTAGQERFHSLGSAFYRGADCCIIVFDTTNSNSLASTAIWHHQFVQLGRIKKPHQFPFYLVGNKIDQSDSREISLQQGIKAAQILYDIAFDYSDEPNTVTPKPKSAIISKDKLPIFFGRNSIKSRVNIDEDDGLVELQSFPVFKRTLSHKASALSFHTAQSSLSSENRTRRGSDSTVHSTAQEQVSPVSTSPTEIGFTFPYFEVSALTGQSIRGLFFHIAEQVRTPAYDTKTSELVDVFEQPKAAPKQSSYSCC